MPFAISKMTVDGSHKVVSLDWVLKTPEGEMSSTLSLARPYGDVPLNEVTQKVAGEWLVEQLPNTEEEYAEEIAAQKELAQAREAYKEYVVYPRKAPTEVEAPAA